jgi:hypothetical protein
MSVIRLLGLISHPRVHSDGIKPTRSELLTAKLAWNLATIEGANSVSIAAATMLYNRASHNRRWVSQVTSWLHPTIVSYHSNEITELIYSFSMSKRLCDQKDHDLCIMNDALVLNATIRAIEQSTTERLLKITCEVVSNMPIKTHTGHYYRNRILGHY